MKIIAFVPARKGSERVIDKNVRPFAGFQHGLIELKLNQLSRVADFEEIVVSSNDPQILDYAERFSQERDRRVKALQRPEEYGISSTSMAKFISEYVSQLFEDGHLFWTHVTHPLFSASHYQEILNKYRSVVKAGFDSLLTVTRHQKFFWRDGRPFSYEALPERWPRSQDLPVVHEINHAVYAIPFEIMRGVGDRVGVNPFFFETHEVDSMDIDWAEQFDALNDISTARRERGQLID